MGWFGKRDAKPETAPTPPASPPPAPATPADRPPPPSLPGSDEVRLAEIGAIVRARLDSNPAVTHLAVPDLELYAVRDFLSPEERAGLIALIDADVKPSTSLRQQGAARSRTSETCLLSADHPLVAAVEARIAELIGQPLDHSETVQGQRYSPGQQFKVHNDYFAAGQYYSEAVASEGGQRTWTAMAFLDRPEKGGHTHFPLVPIAVPPTPGVLLLWNNMDSDGRPNRRSHHEGMMVEAGVKRVLTKWFRERTWMGSAASDALRRV